MLLKIYYLLIVTLLAFALLPTGQCGPVPKVNEILDREILLPKVPQWHCLRYFKHDILMMRRCRHVRVPMAPRKSNVKKLMNDYPCSAQRTNSVHEAAN
uniref:Secreted protein n=1 Tax=Glossina morsitans morsitans TaxID=37546 RepID=A0A1B0FK95_GLOMM